MPIAAGMQLSLVRRNAPLADPAEQLRILSSPIAGRKPNFDASLLQNGLPTLRAERLRMLQVNVGRLCNQTCRHCHVDAGPDRREKMSRTVADACLAFLERSEIELLDITGGAPEMCEEFRHLVSGARALGRRVIDRCNLTILLAPGYTDLPEFLAEQRVEIVASLPCYLEVNCDSQRGKGSFRRSLDALRRLNALGYGRPGSGLSLTLVYNPVGASLPPNQTSLEQDYRRELRQRYGIEFNHLYTITNMPISRFLEDLLQSGQYAGYMQKLIDAFNPAAVEGLMCRETLSVDWEGRLYDCDFNQMLGLGLAEGPYDIFEAQTAWLNNRRIATAAHCFGCTAGAGSGCGGSTVR